MEKADITELSELLYLDKKGRAGIQQWLCYSATSACTKPAPAVAKVGAPRTTVHVLICDLAVELMLAGCSILVGTYLRCETKE